MEIEANSEIFVVCHDFFDSFLEYKEIFAQIVKKNPAKKFLLFNIPGIIVRTKI